MEFLILIKKTINFLIALVFWIMLMPVLVLALFIFPIHTLTQGFKIISTGYSVTGDFWGFLATTILLLYISLRSKAIRKIYLVFPFLYETLKYLAISFIFIGLGTEFLNWSYTKVSQTSHIIGIVVFISSLVLWRVFVSYYYTKNPLVPFMEKYNKKLTYYDTQENNRGDLNV